MVGPRVVTDTPRTRARPPRSSVLVLRGVAMMLVASLAAGISFATEDALPDSPLHDVKLATEQLRLALARSPEHLVAVELDVAGARLQEAAALEAQDRQAEADAAVSAYGALVASAAAHIEEAQPGTASAQLDQFRAEVVKQLEERAAAAAPSSTGSAATALGIASEIATAILRDDHAGAPEIAAAAASAAAKAATNVERRAPAPPAAATPQVTRVVPQATSTVTLSPSPVTTTAPTIAASPTTPSPAAVAVPTATAVPAQTQQTQSGNAAGANQKIDAAAKAAREAADRAQEAAQRAKAAEKAKKDKGSRSKT
jgi:hypothetical protein